MFFRTHRIAFVQGNGDDVLFPGKPFDAVGLVFLDTDVDFIDAEREGEIADALQKFGIFFNHQTVVACQIGLAFRAVDDERVDGHFRRHLHISGEGGTAQTDDARLADAFENVFFRLLRKRRQERRIVLFVVLNDDVLRGCAAVVFARLDGFYRTADG